MIEYRPGKYQLSFIWTLRGSVFPRSLVIASPSAFLAVLLKAYIEANNIDIGQQNSAAYSGFSFVVGFLLVFRTSQAYTRFWDGATKVHEMRSKWCDACGSIIAFSRKSKQPFVEVQQLQHLFIRLFSLMHSLALQQIAVMENEQFVVIDITSLDRASLEYVRQTPEHIRVEIVLSWIQQLIVSNIETGLLPVPPPILSRVFQELSNGMVSMSNAVKISSIPFPFPYAQMTSVLLLFHWILTPLLMCTWTPNVFYAFIFTFVPVFSFWCINMIAGELEQPFGDDVNDLPMHSFQHEINESLLLLVADGTGQLPCMSPHAIVNVDALQSGAPSSRSFTSSFAHLQFVVPVKEKLQDAPNGELHARDIELVVHQNMSPVVTNKGSSGSILRGQNLTDRPGSPKNLPLSNGPQASPGPNADVARDAFTPDPHPQHHRISPVAQRSVAQGSPPPSSVSRPKVGAARSPGLIAVRTPERNGYGESSQIVCPAGSPSSTPNPVPQASRVGGVSLSPCRAERVRVGHVGVPNLETRTSHPSSRPGYSTINLDSLDVPDEDISRQSSSYPIYANVDGMGPPPLQGPFGRGLQALVQPIKYKPEIPPMPIQYEGGMYITDVVDFGLDPGASLSP